VCIETVILDCIDRLLRLRTSDGGMEVDVLHPKKRVLLLPEPQNKNEKQHLSSGERERVRVRECLYYNVRVRLSFELR